VTDSTVKYAPSRPTQRRQGFTFGRYRSIGPAAQQHRPVIRRQACSSVIKILDFFPVLRRHLQAASASRALARPSPAASLAALCPATLLTLQRSPPHSFRRRIASPPRDPSAHPPA